MNSALIEPALETRGVTKRFGEFTAVDAVSLAFAAGRIHAVVGQNGAGKTTFSRLICGLYEPSAGEIRVDGSPLRVGDIRSARQQGVDMVHQNFSLPPSFTVAEALELFNQDSKLFGSRSGLNNKWKALLKTQGSSIDVKRRVRDLSVESRQSLEIIRALSGAPKVLILDEPTAVLAPSEVESLFARVRTLRDDGLTVLIILHKLSEVFTIADTVSVLRDGKVTLATAPIDSVSPEELTARIIGPDTILPQSAAAAREAVDTTSTSEHASGESAAALSVSQVSTLAGQSDSALTDISLTVGRGEILGIAGVEGNGQETLLDVLSGFQRIERGSIRFGTRDMTGSSVLERRRDGMRYVPSDRNSQGVSLTTSLWENVSLGDLLRTGKRWLSPRRCKAAVVKKFAAWSVKYRGPNQLAGELSGGNLQRVILARELGEGTRIVIAGNPTRGLDLAATAFVRTSLSTMAKDGVAIVLVSADLDEVREMSTRICVIRGGQIVADLPRTAAIEELGAAMVGGADVR
ncbi:MAG: ATP-binding cassette domain-containing protein [Microbacteriaceae bacterium]|nr:MAG: ATP-binding cassette domain-containing protein [Microbacteriaceae bacterium]